MKFAGIKFKKYFGDCCFCEMILVLNLEKILCHIYYNPQQPELYHYVLGKIKELVESDMPYKGLQLRYKIAELDYLYKSSPNLNDLKSSIERMINRLLKL